MDRPRFVLLYCRRHVRRNFRDRLRLDGVVRAHGRGHVRERGHAPEHGVDCRQLGMLRISSRDKLWKQLKRRRPDTTH